MYRVQHRLAGWSLLIGIVVSLPAQAQIAPTPDGTGTQLQFDGQTYQIGGGTQAGANLFHSFEHFNLDAGQIANFRATRDLQNILSRVSGGNPSRINGLIQVSGGSPNLYLMNPVGIVFGSQASLNVPADFIATTADRIGFESGGWFNASGGNDYANLVGTPNQFAFLNEQPAAIVNAGDLAVEPGQNLGLYSGTIVNAGRLQAPGGNVTLAAVPGENRVRLSQPGMLLSLEVPTDAVAAGIAPTDLPTLLTGTGLGSIATPGNVITFGLVQGNSVHLAAAGQVQPSNPNLIRTHDGAHSAPTVTRFSDTGEPMALTFLDITVPDYETLLYGGRAGTTTIAITPEESGIAKITETLANAARPVDEVHIVTEGNAGNFWLGQDFVSAENIDPYRDQLQSWAGGLSENADILLYSCFTALGAVGEALISAIATETGADVAASTDLTGSAALGGDWQLEASIGQIEASLAFEADVLKAYDDTLAIYTVINGNDTGIGSLREAIGFANATAVGDEIRFAPAVTLVGLTSGQLDIDTATGGDLTITGQGTNVTIERAVAAPDFRILDITGNGDVNLDFLTIRNGKTTGAIPSGGGIRILAAGGNLTLTNTTVSGNQATGMNGRGGGIHSQGNVTLTNSVISNNQTTGLNGQGGGVRGSNVTLNNTVVSDNQTVGNNSFGGGIRGSSVTLNNSTVSGNWATGDYSDGGGISSSNVTLTNSVVSGNWTAGDDSDGGGIESFNVTLTNSIVSGNWTTGNDSDGGGIRGFTNVTLTNSVVSGNWTADSVSSGGGIFGGDITLNNSTVSGNQTMDSASSGGGIFGGDITLNNSTVSGNQTVGNSSQGGGIICLSVILNDSTVSGNQTAGDSSFAGGIRSSSNVTLNNSTVSGNQTVGNNSTGGGIVATDVMLSNSTVSGNRTTDPSSSAGGIYLTGALTLANSTIAFNSTAGSGGGISVGGTSTHQITNSIIAANSAPIGSDLAGNFSASTFTANLIQSTAGATGAPTHGVNGNIIGLDPQLAPLANNGGPTQTHALLPGSPAIDAGNNALAAALRNLRDQRGVTGILNGIVDIGAFEFVPAPAPVPAPALNLPRLDFLQTPALLLDLIARLEADQALEPRAFVLEQFESGDAAAAWQALECHYTDSFLERLSSDRTQLDSFWECITNGNLPALQDRLQQLAQTTGTQPAVVYAFARLKQLELLVLHPTGTPHHFSVPVTRSELLAGARQFAEEVIDPTRRLTAAYLPPSQQLYDWLLRPLQAELAREGTDTLLFSLDRGLRSFPLAALHDGEEFLIERYRLSSIPSLELAKLQHTDVRQANILAMGVSNFQFLRPLPAVPLELAAIEQEMAGGKVLRNDGFTLDNLKAQRQAAAAPIVHLATHAEFSPDAGGLIEFWEGSVSLEQFAQIEWSDPKLALLVLSACRTAVGNFEAEYGFAGLAWQADVETAQASLWYVSDVGTLALMREFYRELRQTHLKAEALRQAQLSLLRGEVWLEADVLVAFDEPLALPPELTGLSDRTFQHPYYWAGFTTIGNPW